MPLKAESCLTKEEVGKDRISALPDDLLVQILAQVPVKQAVTTMLLSKRWSFIWSLVPKLDYSESYEVQKSVWDFLEKSWQLNKALTLEGLRIKLGRYCPKHADVGKYISKAVDRCVRELSLELFTFSRLHILPACLYTCKTLVKLTLMDQILVDVPSSACLPSLESMNLTFVVYKDEASLVRLLSSCHVLKVLFVSRDKRDNLTRFSVKVSSLQRLTYKDYDAGVSGRSLVIDSPGLRYVKIHDPLRENFSIHNMPRLEVAFVNVDSQTNYKILRSFSSVMFLDLVSTDVACCSGINFSRLIELKLSPYCLDYNWLESLMLLLHNSPNLKVLMINTAISGNLSVSWNQPSSVPTCLLSHLEIFEWKAYKGKREEKQFVAYILANSISLKTVGISLSSFYKYKPGENRLEMEQSMMEELESLYRVSASSQLLFSAQLRWGMSRKTRNHVHYVPSNDSS